MHKVISSMQNSHIKQIAKLRHRRARDQMKQTLVEGKREITLALKNGFEPVELFYCPEIMQPSEFQSVLNGINQNQNPPIYEVTEPVFAKLAYRQSGDGLLMVTPYWPVRLNTLTLSQRPFLAVLENVEKPGNVGAVLRTGDGVGIDAVIVCATSQFGTFDPYNPNIIRASLGAIFTLPMVVCESSEFIEWINEKKIYTVASSPNANIIYSDLDYTQSVAFLMGSEADGLSFKMLAAADNTVVIPLEGQLDSLNLSVSTAVLLYEAYRQRHLQSRN